MVVAFWAAMAFAAGGDLDSTFSGDGKTTTTIGSGSAAYGVAIQPDGGIVAAGFADTLGGSQFALARYDQDGSLDTTFSGDGRLTTKFGQYASANAISVQPDGRIVAAGSSNSLHSVFALARYDVNGSLDTTFSGDGRITTPFGSDAFANSVSLQADGKIVAAGSTNTGFAVARYNTDGSLDTTFGGDGKVATTIASGATAYGVAVQADGKIVAAGTSYIGHGFHGHVFAAARYDTDGSLDTTFSEDGKLTTMIGSDATAYALSIQADGRIVITGYGFINRHVRSTVVRYNSDGSLDTTFSGDGRVATTIGSGATAYGVSIQADGRIVTAGSGLLNGSLRFALVRYNTNGSRDTTFSGDGKLTTQIASSGDATAFGVAIQADGKIVAAGHIFLGGITEFALTRYMGN